MVFTITGFLGQKHTAETFFICLKITTQKKFIQVFKKKHFSFKIVNSCQKKCLSFEKR